MVCLVGFNLQCPAFRYGNKGILHKHISQVSAPAPTSDPITAASEAAAAGGSTTAASEAAVTDGSSPQGGSPTATAATVNTPFRPADSVLEGLQELVYVPKGYICSNTQVGLIVPPGLQSCGLPHS